MKSLDMMKTSGGEFWPRIESKGAYILHKITTGYARYTLQYLTPNLSLAIPLLIWICIFICRRVSGEGLLLFGKF